jgi:hypothetical protein
LEFVNRDKKNKSVLIKFSSKYVVKDEEIAMIIEKGKLKNTCLDMKKMQITDSCLMFLANCDKMLNIVSLDISHCPLVTDSGGSVAIRLSSLQKDAKFTYGWFGVP